jgi:ligand-binding sensor domain-containing protein
MVFSSGHWSWYGYDSLERRLSPNVAAEAISSSSDIQALAETADGTLWIGTASGLLRLQGDYDQRLQRWSSTEEGLASAFVVALAGAGNSLYVATHGGTSWSADGQHLAVIAGLNGADVATLKTADFVADEQAMEVHELDEAAADGGAHKRSADPSAPAVVAASTRGTWLLRGNQVQRLGSEPAKDAVVAGDDVYELRNDGLWTYPLPAPDPHRARSVCVARWSW